MSKLLACLFLFGCAGSVTAQSITSYGGSVASERGPAGSISNHGTQVRRFSGGLKFWVFDEWCGPPKGAHIVLNAWYQCGALPETKAFDTRRECLRWLIERSHIMNMSAECTLVRTAP